MSNEQHANGSLRYDFEPGYCGELLTENGSSICSFADEPRKANAERLVACWNACQGIDTADLLAVKVSIIHKLHDEAAQRVLAQRDELLAALKAVDGALRESWSAGTNDHGVPYLRCYREGFEHIVADIEAAHGIGEKP